ncbi:MAG: 16S rRNA (guanine(966)-N(2))-methyltransferase RsmD [Akkermansiaceae bacterium]|jgi:16S rRNA (guanine966-N2)-methyltransferase|nr:16S rRNA (guanine(966)-N(2))-methyltransferase RsmD [Akkermansiaceae bacterium]
MRIIAGTAGGIRLKVPKRVTRPSTDRLREALFSILVVKLDGARVLDLFSGSGALGVEALSRGASSATLVEENSQACKVIEENLKTAKLQGELRRGDVFSVLGRLGGRFDVVFADPPYAVHGRDDLAQKLLDEGSLPGLMAEEGLLVLEVETERKAPEGEKWSLVDRRVYGSSAVLFYEVAGGS